MMDFKSTIACLSIRSLTVLSAIVLLGDRVHTYVLPRSQLDASYPYTREQFQYDGYENRNPNNLPGTIQEYQYGYGSRNPNNFPEARHESFVIVQDNTMMSVNYNNAVEEIYLDAASSPDHQVYDYGRGGALEGPQPTFEREDVDGEDLETVREFGDYNIMPYNGRAPSGIEYDVDGLDYVAHDPRVLEEVAKSRATYAGPNTDNADYINQNQNNQQRDSWGLSY